MSINYDDSFGGYSIHVTNGFGSSTKLLLVISQWFVNSFNASKYFKEGGLASSLKGIAMNFENQSRDFCL